MNVLFEKIAKAIKERGGAGLFFSLMSKVNQLYYLAELRSKIGKGNIGKKCHFEKDIEVRCKRIKIGENVYIGRNVMLCGIGEILIGDGTYISDYVSILANERVEIGENCNIGSYTYIIDSDHGVRKGKKIQDQPHISRKVKIKNDVWIAASSLITAGSRIESGAVIGGNSVVRGHVPSNAIAAGSPALVRKYRE
jgi:acetyltransferase-like isoleucine patch superfamily enzyme